MRTAELSRTTKETDIYIKINLDGSGVSEIDTGLPFFDHMLILFAKHGKFDLTVKVKGDLEVDAHHSMEDTGLVLGKVIADALGDGHLVATSITAPGYIEPTLVHTEWLNEVGVSGIDGLCEF